MPGAPVPPATACPATSDYLVVLENTMANTPLRRPLFVGTERKSWCRKPPHPDRTDRVLKFAFELASRGPQHLDPATE